MEPLYRGIYPLLVYEIFPELGDCLCIVDCLLVTLRFPVHMDSQIRDKEAERSSWFVFFAWFLYCVNGSPLYLSVKDGTDQHKDGTGDRKRNV